MSRLHHQKTTNWQISTNIEYGRLWSFKQFPIEHSPDMAISICGMFLTIENYGSSNSLDEFVKLNTT